MAALRTLDPAISFSGVGGRAMTAQGIASPFSTDDLSIIGFASIPQKLPLILRRLAETRDADHQLRAADGLGLAAVAGARDARLRRRGAGRAAVRAGRVRAPERPAL